MMAATDSRTVWAAVGACWLVVGMAAGSTDVNFGVPALPDAEAKPEVARAVEAYYQTGVSKTQTLTAAVYLTSAAFDTVHDFYRPHMDSGKWGWRKKTRALVQQTETLSFMRAQLSEVRQGRSVPEVLKPFFGDPALTQGEFKERLERLRKQNQDVTIQVVEGTRTIQEGAHRTQVRITVERPFIDPANWTLVDRTRVVLVKVQ